MRKRKTRSVRTAGQHLHARQPSPVPGVGARQADLFPEPGGGGYLNECTSPKIWEKAKLTELREMGLPAVWLRVAEAIGYDNFLIFWRILDVAAETREVQRSENESMIELKLRRYASFKRYQRNRYIEFLSASGMPSAAIERAVKSELGETLDRSNIRKVAKRGRMGR